MERLPFPELIDNSMRSDFISCPQKFYWAYLRKLTGSSPNIHLHAGGSFAAALESAKRSFYEKGKPEAEALRDGLEALLRFYGPIQAPVTRSGDKSCDNVVRAYDSYFQQYPLGRDTFRPHMAPNGVAMLEFTFAIPMELKHPETGNPLLYGGRTDEIAEGNGMLVVADEKTTSQLGETWTSQWRLESQFTGYIKAARDHGLPVQMALVRGIGLLKTKITHQEAHVYRSQWEIDRWWEQLHRDVKRMIACWQDGHFDLALSKNACAAYGGCEFRMLTESPEPEKWIESHYRKRTWNPLEKDSGEHLLENPQLMQQLEAPELHVPELDA
jgi:hypothetical protein